MDLPAFDVVVVGAGPTGFTLAIDLGRRGIRTLLVERDSDTKEWPKMDRSNPRTMEIYRRIGFADRVRAAGYPPEASMDVFVTTRVADPPLVRLRYPTVAECRERTDAEKGMGHPLEPYQLVAQNDIEPVLKSVAEDTANLTVRFSRELVGFEEDEEGVTVRLECADGTVEAVRGRYLAGCDGGRSFVRKALGIELEGRGDLVALRQVTFRSESLYDALPYKGRHFYIADETNSMIVVQGSRKDFTLNASLPEDADLEQAIRERLGIDADFTIKNSISYKFHLLLAKHYRVGRVLIAGDAAHLVPPTGGLGMNTGVGDAVDLSWKLAGTIEGWAGPRVLDSYETERRAIGRRNMDAAGRAAGGMMTWRGKCGPEVFEDTSAGAAKRDEVARAAEVYQRWPLEMVGVELGYSYAGSDMIAEEPPAEWDTREYVPHTRPGIRIPHLWLNDGRAVQDVLGPDYNLLDLTGAAESGGLEAEFARIGVSLDVVCVDDPHAAEVYGAGLLLLRPDLHIYWRGDQLPQDIEGLASAATGHRGPFSDTAQVGERLGAHPGPQGDSQ
ncbi:FAD-dependent monooxygenase [Streptomyces justiciae]|uniref:FAD-dependent monooxygenase n=1 Tax=Streptomyces justiciae TaxID=2780140 RepID=UPI0021196FE6|nr:FAD-dependent monooxygenase [Streptomyces justiciae]MCW8379735.1 FAD-dependent monooxygenase [Streptomyces justiciae]